MNNCEKCGNPVPEEKAFCPNCGAAMAPERERTTETEEGMGETMYEYERPSKVLQAPMVPLPAEEAEPVKSEPTPKPSPPLIETKPAASAAPPAQKKPSRQPSVVAYGMSNAAEKETPAANNNRRLHLILGASAVLFALSILVVVILYIMGKI